MDTDSHMVKHAVVEHGGDMEIKFSMKVLKSHMTAFRRQIHEAVKIQRNEKNSILNSKGEYNCCSLPRLTVKVGAKEIKEKEVEEQLTEQEIEEEILRMRNKKRKEIGDTGRPPGKKRRRWKLEHRKEMQLKRRREFSQAEREDHEIQVYKRRKTESEIHEGDTGGTFQDRRKFGNRDTLEVEAEKILPHSEGKEKLDSSEVIQEHDIIFQGRDQQFARNYFNSDSNSNQNVKRDRKNSENVQYYPIFKFSAVRQKGGEDTQVEYKANLKLSQKTSHPSTTTIRESAKPRSKVKPKLKLPPYSFKPLNHHFLSTKQKDQDLHFLIEG